MTTELKAYLPPEIKYTLSCINQTLINLVSRINDSDRLLYSIYLDDLQCYRYQLRGQVQLFIRYGCGNNEFCEPAIIMMEAVTDVHNHYYNYLLYL